MEIQLTKKPAKTAIFDINSKIAHLECATNIEAGLGWPV